MRFFYSLAGIAFLMIGGWVLMAPGMGLRKGEQTFGSGPPSVPAERHDEFAAAPAPAQALAPAPPVPSAPIPVSQADFGDKWPFSAPVTEGTLDCIDHTRPIFISGGIRYTLTAYPIVGPSLKRLGLVDFQTIWRHDPTSKRKGAKIDIEPMIQLAYTLCKG